MNLYRMLKTYQERIDFVSFESAADIGAGAAPVRGVTFTQHIIGHFGTIFTGHMTKSTVLEHQRKPVGRRDQA